MLFEIAHLTRFTYDRPVLLEPLTVRLRPRSDIFQRLISFDLTVEPAPEGTSQMMDVEGNGLTQVWFLGMSRSLTLRTAAMVETLRPNPYDYIVLDPESLRAPTPRPPPPPAAPPPAGETPARGSGACRDLAVLFVDACRSVGIAARFV